MTKDMDILITWLHYAATFFLSLGIILFVRFLFSFFHLTSAYCKTKVCFPTFGFFFLASISEAVSCYFAAREDDLQTTAALAVISLVLFVCFSVKSIRRKLAKREGAGNL